MIRSTLAIMAAVVAVCARAEAAVYTFSPTSIGPSPLPFVYTAQDAAFTLAITDDAVKSGSFNYDYSYRYFQSGNPPQTVYRSVATGDVQALQLFQGNRGAISFAGGSGPTGTGSDYFRVNLTFSSTGQIAAGALAYQTDTYNIVVAGSGPSFNGVFGVGNLRQTSVSGDFTGGFSSVPEPATLGLLAAALSLVGVRQRRGREAVVAILNVE